MVGRRHRHTRKASGARFPEHASTMHGLHEWTEAKFEKLGWMVLAKAKGHHDKIAEYKRGLRRLRESIVHVASEYRDPDRKHDLNVLRMKVECLQDFVEKHL